MDKNNTSLKSSVLPKQGRIDILNNSEKEMQDKAKVMFENFKNKGTLDKLKNDFKFKGEGNSIYELQENIKKDNPENFNKSIKFIQDFISHSTSIRNSNINNFKLTNLYEPSYYNHKSLTATYAKNPTFHEQSYKQTLKDFTSIYNSYIKEKLPNINDIEDTDFC